MEDTEKQKLLNLLEMVRELYADGETSEAESVLDDVIALIEEL
jgi:hypothetical protein